VDHWITAAALEVDLRLTAGHKYRPDRQDQRETIKEI
jgi:hypothetical protein